MVLCKFRFTPKFPELKVSLQNDSELLNGNSNFYFTSDRHVMRIVEVKKSNQGKYRCVASNGFGSVEKVFYVNVHTSVQWSSWSSFSSCSVTCGSDGIQYRSRACLLSDGSPAIGDDYKCVGENIEMRKCHRLPCPIHGKFGAWSKWSRCPSCIDESVVDVPTQKRQRKCDSPSPSNGGLDCSGIDVEEMKCKLPFCPVKGGWSDWTEWSDCKAIGSSCKGHRMRQRLCNNPKPKHNGSKCEGENVEYDECNVARCTNYDLRKSLNADYESSDSEDKYKELAEFEIKNEAGQVRNFQFSSHREVEYSHPQANNLNLPKIKVTLDTYKPISEETYNEHIKKTSPRNENVGMEFEDSTEVEELFENLSEDFDSTVINQVPVRKCLQGFHFNPIDEQCEDINECRRQNNCRDDEVCINLIGSYRCERMPKDEVKRSAKLQVGCAEGYELKRGQCAGKGMSKKQLNEQH